MVPSEANPISIALFCPKKLFRLFAVGFIQPSSVNAGKLLSNDEPRFIYCDFVLSKLIATGILSGLTAPSAENGQVVFVITAVGDSGDLIRKGVFAVSVIPLFKTVIKPLVADTGTVAVS